MLQGRDIAIIGAGVAGLACAVALARQGAKVRVFEQAENIHEIGAGLQITPNGVAVLDALGLADRARQVGAKTGAVVLRDYRRGTKIASLNLAQDSGNRPYLLFHRSDLIDLLVQGAKSVGVKLITNHSVVNVIDGREDAELRFANGAHSSAEMVIGADGLNSKLRPILNGPADPFFTGQVAWRATVQGAISTDVDLIMGPGRHVVTYPLRNHTMTNIVAVEERKTWAKESWDQHGDPDAFRQAFSMFSQETRMVLDQVSRPREWGLFRHPVAENWHGSRCVLVGDAAHPTLPFLAQGANMALEDAWVLADSLASLPVPQALAHYQNRRRARVSRVVAAANANARIYHLNNPVARVLAHSALRIAGATAPALLSGRYDWIHRHDVTKS